MSDQVPDPHLQPKTASESPDSPDSAGLIADDRYDAGETGCGELIVKLNGRVKKLQPHQVLHLISLDSGAIEDIPAWCQLTGHRLLQADHPDYWIARRAD